MEWVATEALRLYHRPTVNYRLVINDLDVDRFVISGLATMNEPQAPRTLLLCHTRAICAGKLRYIGLYSTKF